MPAMNKGFVVVYPWDDEELKIKDYQQQHPRQQSPNIIRVEYVKSKNALIDRA